MINVLENDVLRIEIDSVGAELSSIKTKKDGLEFLWQGDPSVWARKSPILFPIVGKLKDNEYFVENEKYELDQHGFARDMEFQVEPHDKEILEYKLKYNEESLKKYPYKFLLTITYELKGNSLRIGYKVKNIDSIDVYFSIGAHPGFNMPIMKEEKLEDYYLEFDKLETVDKYQLNTENNVSLESIPFLNNEKVIPMTKDIFNNGAIILLDVVSTSLALKSKNNSREVCVEYDGFPYLGIWGHSDNSPFVCIEPWYGVTDFEDTDKQYKTKTGIQKLEVSKEFIANYYINIK
ncbi:aldose 1-epimerase family protein [Vallitalea sp.]|jgi:galactose mutarotase-like enzyme|uniref:aldose 1-epimerase family protein n=1 Tax=Vallitalea sp. TaxID=1882829 RepID=UPI0025D176FB|nr:aldose 1-epimerase family protein [Vallitalea sp.]MCT4686626.1 aldose 1-epimerase family protein [Vallitalea sp.]